MLRNMHEIASLEEGQEVQVGGFAIRHNTVSWEGSCAHCSGSLAVTHCFSDPDFGQHARVILPDACPNKPVKADAPTWYYVEEEQA